MARKKYVEAAEKVLYYESELDNAQKNLISYEDNLKIAEDKIEEITEKLRAKKAYDVEKDMKRYQDWQKRILKLFKKAFGI